MNLYRRISEIMSTELITVEPTTSITDVSALFRDHNIHHLPVLDETNRVVGIISRHDYNRLEHHYTQNGWEIAEAANVQLHKTLIAKDVMSTDVVQLEGDVLILKAVDIFLSNRIHSVIIHDGGRCIGIITPYDILDEMKKLLTLLQ